MILTRSQVKYIQSLSEKKFRKEQGVFVAEGPKIVSELITGGSSAPVALYATEAWLQQSGMHARLPGGILSVIDAAELQKISFLTTPNEVLGIFRQPLFDEPLPVENTLTLLLDGIQDPGNLGTIVRIADWFGISQVVAAPGSADIFNPKVVQSTMGSIARVKVTYCDLPNFIGAYPHIPVYAATLDGKPLGNYQKVLEGFVLIGNESKGLSAALVEAAGFRVSIPKYGYAESLNAAVAAGIILSHLKG